MNIFCKHYEALREQAIERTDMPSERSCQIFTDASAAAREMVKGAAHGADPVYRMLLLDRRAMADWIYDRLEPMFVPDDPKCRPTLRSVARHVADTWDVKKVNPSEDRNRGSAYAHVRHIRLRDDAGRLIPEAETERQAIGGRAARRIVQIQTIDLILTALEQLHDDDKGLTLENVLPMIPKHVRHPRSVRRNFAGAVAAYWDGRLPSLDTWCMLGGGGTSRPEQQNLLPADDTPNSVPRFIPAAPASHPVLTGSPGSYAYHGQPTVRASCSVPEEFADHDSQTDQTPPVMPAPRRLVGRYSGSGPRKPMGYPITRQFLDAAREPAEHASLRL